MSINRRITLHILRERIVSFLPGIAILLGFMLIFGWYLYEQSFAERSDTSGKVISWGVHELETGPASLRILVELESGARVTASAAPRGKPPVVGETIDLTKKETPSGLTFYRWTR
jgi:hypothetical protein